MAGRTGDGDPATEARWARAIQRKLKENPTQELREEVAGLVRWVEEREMPRRLPPDCDVPPELLPFVRVPGEERPKRDVGLKAKGWARWQICDDCGEGRWVPRERPKSGPCLRCHGRRCHSWIKPEHRARGARINKTTLTVEQVLEVKRSEEHPELLAARFGVTESTIRSIRKGRSWRWVES